MNDDSRTATVRLFAMVGTIGFIVAIPLVGFALLGREVDRALNTSPLFFLAGVLVAIIVSTVIIYRKTVYLMNEAEKQSFEQEKK